MGSAWLLGRYSFNPCFFHPSGHGFASPSPIFSAVVDSLMGVPLRWRPRHEHSLRLTDDLRDECAAGVFAGRVHFHARLSHPQPGTEFEEPDAQFPKGGAGEVRTSPMCCSSPETSASASSGNLFPRSHSS